MIYSLVNGWAYIRGGGLKPGELKSGILTNVRVISLVAKTDLPLQGWV